MTAGKRCEKDEVYKTKKDFFVETREEETRKICAKENAAGHAKCDKYEVHLEGMEFSSIFGMEKEGR
eukprot:6189213-Pleurochrysis_carterae.AAC.2